MVDALNREQVLERLRQQLPHLRDKYGVERVAVYGSFAQGRPRQRSDVDIVVHLGRPLGLEFVALAYYLEDLLGRKVDLATFETLQRGMQNPRYRHIAENVQRSLVYA